MKLSCVLSVQESGLREDGCSHISYRLSFFSRSTLLKDQSIKRHHQLNFFNLSLSTETLTRRVPACALAVALTSERVH